MRAVNGVTKVLLQPKWAHSERCLRKRSYRVLISASWSTHEVLKVQWLCTPPILCSSDVAAASLSTNDSSTLAFSVPHKNFSQRLLKNLDFHELVDI